MVQSIIKGALIGSFISTISSTSVYSRVPASHIDTNLQYTLVPGIYSILNRCNCHPKCINWYLSAFSQKHTMHSYDLYWRFPMHHVQRPFWNASKVSMPAMRVAVQLVHWSYSLASWTAWLSMELKSMAAVFITCLSLELKSCSNQTCNQSFYWSVWFDWDAW